MMSTVTSTKRMQNYSLVCAQKRLMRREDLCDGPGIVKCLSCATDFYGFPKGPLATLANRFWAERERRAVDMFLPVSRAVAERTQMDKHKVPYCVIPNFIPDNADMACDDANPLLAQLPKEDFLLFVGDLNPDKGVNVLLQAYAEMNTHIPLVLIGRHAPGLSESIPPNVLIMVMGGWPHDAVMAAWARCTIALTPSVWLDPCPTVAMEAMVMGKPVIATSCGGLSDIVVDGETGFLVLPGDPHELQKAIQCLLDDLVRRERMGDIAKQRVVEFQAKSVVSCIEQVYHDILGRPLADLQDDHKSRPYKQENYSEASI